MVGAQGFSPGLSVRLSQQGLSEEHTALPLV